MVVTYKSRQHVDELGRVISEFLALSPYHYCASVENSQSRDTSTALTSALADHSSRHLHLTPSENRGFAPAVNQALDAAADQWGEMPTVILLNPDVRTDATVIEELARRVSGNSRVGIAAPLLVGPDGHVDRGTARRRWTLLTLFAEVAGIGRLVPRRWSRYIRVLDEPAAVDMTSGAFMAVQSEIIRGGLDERLPLYLEDQQLCHRARRAGMQVVVFPDLQAFHEGGASRVLNTDSQRNLRCMELAAAPALSWADWTSRPISLARLAIGLGASIRMLAALLARVRGDSHWSRDQFLLGKWLLAWSWLPRKWGQRL